MTEPSDAAIAKALRRSGMTEKSLSTIRANVGNSWCDAILAHAKTLQEVNDALAGYWGGVAKIPDRFFPFIIPQPDPDEELAREVAGLDEVAFRAALATIKRLREQGRLHGHHARKARGMKISASCLVPP